MHIIKYTFSVSWLQNDVLWGCWGYLTVDEILNKPIQNLFLETIWVQTNVTVSYLFPRCWIYPHSIVSPKYSNHQITWLVFLGRSWVTEQKPVRLCLIEIPGKSLAWHLAEVRLEDEALWCTSTTSISPDRQKVFPTSTTQGSKEQQQSVNAANVLLAMNMRSWVNEKLCALFLYH